MNVNFIDTMMCSPTCPCMESAAQPWQEAYNETTIKQYHRTWETLSAPPYVPMRFGGQDGDEKRQFETFEDCYVTKIRDHPEVFGKDAKAKDAYNDFSQKDSISLLRHYEKEYDCSGVCDLPLFIW